MTQTSVDAAFLESHDADHVLLPGGLRVDFLPIQPSDEDRLHDFRHRLSPETIRRRFFYVHPELSPAELRRFTRVDHVDREAIGRGRRRRDRRGREVRSDRHWS